MRSQTTLNLVTFTTSALLMASAHAVLWTPAEITTTIWLDAEDASTLTEDTGGVAQWNDKSGNGFDVTQGSADRRPDLLTGGWSNGNDSLNLTQYNGAAQTRKDTLGRNVTNDGIIGNAYTLFVVVDAQSLDNEEWIHTGRTTTGKENRTQINNNGVKVRSDGSNGGSGNGAYVAGEQILQFTLDATLSEVRRNGVQITGNSGTFVPAALTGDFTINGRNSVDGHAGMTGELGEFIYLAYNPDQTTRELIEGYLAWKWGLQATLDIAHPYKNAAPQTGGSPADLDNDGDVDDADFGIAFAAFTGPGGVSNSPADLDNDGDVDDADFGIAFAAFTGPGGAAATVPEPTSLVLLLAAGGLLVTRRRR